MAGEVIAQKLESLRRCLERIAEKCPPTPDDLAADADLQDILTLNLTRAVQLCVDLGSHLISSMDVPPPNSMGQTFDLLASGEIISTDLAGRLKKAVGFRNIAVHNYEKVDWVIVHSIASQRLGDFTEFARAVASR